MEWVDMFNQVNVYDPVVVDAQALTEGVLRNFKTAVQVSFKRCGEVEVQGESQVAFAEMME
jgi:hypothetical protein